MKKKSKRQTPKRDVKFEVRIAFRISKKEFKRVSWLADTYADGSLSKWGRHALVNAERKILK